jgi:signal transduction histidine kinase
MVDQIVHDIETLTEPLAPKIAADVAQEIDAIVANWKGMMHVEVELSPRTSLMLDQDSLLAQKVVAACSEAITNASRHGQATRVAVALHVVDEETALRITVEDNGRGALAVIKPGIGLQDITADGGQWKFIASSSGTTFQVDFAITPSTV